MTGAEWIALWTGLPAVIIAGTGFVIAWKAHGAATDAKASAAYTASQLKKP